MTALAQPVAASLPKPVFDERFWGDSVRLIGFGKPYDWSLRLYQGNTPKSELEALAPSLYLPKITLEYGMGKFLYAPSPRLFNAEVCSESETMPLRVEVWSKSHQNTIWLYRGKDADGLMLSRGNMYVVSAAGCPIVILRDSASGALGVAHAGLRSIIDEGRLKGERPRKHESVVFSLSQAMHAHGVRNFSSVEALIAFPIDPQDFTYPWDHPEFGELNKKRTEYLVNRWGHEAIANYDNQKRRELGRPDLAAIIKSQCTSLGIPTENIQVLSSPPKRVWHDTRQGGDILARNLIFVQHRHI